MAVNAGTTYGVDGSAENGFGLGADYRSTFQQTQATRASQAGKAGLPLWLVIGAVILAVVYL